MKQAISVLRDRVSLYIFMSFNLGFKQHLFIIFIYFYHDVDCEFSPRFLWDKQIYKPMMTRKLVGEQLI